MSRRSERTGKLIQREISELLERQVNDPRLSSLISVTDVSVSLDLKHAKVFISAMGDESDREEMLAGFNRASGFFRRELSSQLKMRCPPELTFHYDDSIERGARLLKMMSELTSDE